MSKNKIIDFLYVTAVYGTGLYYGYKIGKSKGQYEAYTDCAEQLNEVITSTRDYAAEAVILDREKEES